MKSSALPLLDEHVTVIAANVDNVWAALLETVDRTFSRRGAGTYARIVGCVDTTAAGPRPLAEGATIPGFRVVATDPQRNLVLEGCHRFSAYELRFRIDELDSTSSRLRAESRAEFPGVAGRAYRLLVVSTGAHVIAVKRVLASVRQRAERQAATRS